MQTLALSAVPNQTFSTTLDSNRYTFAIYQCNGIMCYDITLNEQALISGQRLTNGTFLIPFFTYEGENGNFMLLTNNFQLPDYEQFGLTQTLVYFEYADIAAAIAAAPYVPPPITAYAVA
jgi:hypothetical protein